MKILIFVSLTMILLFSLYCGDSITERSKTKTKDSEVAYLPEKDITSLRASYNSLMDVLLLDLSEKLNSRLPKNFPLRFFNYCLCARDQLNSFNLL